MHPEADLPAIIARLPLQAYSGTCYRLVDFAILTSYNPMMPLYTLGPGKNGQRYTAKGGPNALYAAEDLITAHAEYHRVERIVLANDPTCRVSTNPTVEITIQVDLQHVLDIADPHIQATLGTNVPELTGPWRKQMMKKLFCPTHVLAAAVFAHGKIQALRYPSAQGPDYCNLIVWEERLSLPSFILVNDSTGTLSARIPAKRESQKRTRT